VLNEWIREATSSGVKWATQDLREMLGVLGLGVAC
jgi:hypothetical protein